MPFNAVIVVALIVLCSVCRLSTAFRAATFSTSWFRRNTRLTAPSFRSQQTTRLFSRPPDLKWTQLPDDIEIKKGEVLFGEELRQYLNDNLYMVPQSRPDMTPEEKERAEMEEFFRKDEREEFKIPGDHKIDSMTDDVNPVQVDMSDLAERWRKLCLEQNQTEHVREFSLADALPLVLSNQSIELLNATLTKQSAEAPVSFISEEELRRLWTQHSHKATGKSENKFDITEALLLLRDEEETQLMGEEEEEVAEEEVEEVVVTERELRWIWNKRSKIAWGMPSKKFNIRNSLLLLDSDHDIHDDAEIVEKGTEKLSPLAKEWNGVSDPDDAEEPTVYNTMLGGLYGAGGYWYYEMFGGDCITGEPRGHFPIVDVRVTPTRTYTTTISALPYSTATTTKVVVTSTATGLPIEGDTVEDTADPDSKEYVLQPPSTINYYELQERRKKGFLFEHEQPWKKFKGRENTALRIALKDAVDDIDRHPEINKSFKKRHNALDEDHEVGFSPDWMVGDSMYETFGGRIPMDWNDPEAYTRSKEYNDTVEAVLADTWKDDTDDFEEYIPLWQKLGLPYDQTRYLFGPRMKRIWDLIPDTTDCPELLPDLTWKFCGSALYGKNSGFGVGRPKQTGRKETATNNGIVGTVVKEDGSLDWDRMDWDFHDYLDFDTTPYVPSKVVGTYPFPTSNNVDTHPTIDAKDNSSEADSGGDVEDNDEDDEYSDEDNDEDDGYIDDEDNDDEDDDEGDDEDDDDEDDGYIDDEDNDDEDDDEGDGYSDEEDDEDDGYSDEEDDEDDGYSDEEDNEDDGYSDEEDTDEDCVFYPHEDTSITPLVLCATLAPEPNITTKTYKPYSIHSAKINEGGDDFNTIIHDMRAGPEFCDPLDRAPYPEYPPDVDPFETDPATKQRVAQPGQVTHDHSRNLEMFAWGEMETFADECLMAEAIQSALDLSDLYLSSHKQHDMDEDDEIKRHFTNRLLNENNVNESIPAYYTPDLHRGVNYTDEIMEMFGKISLVPWRPDPSVEFKDDIFTPNNETFPMNIIGTIREQHVWTPRRDLEHVIELEKIPYIQPVIDFLNYGGELLSTKDDIIIFRFLASHVRHIVGIRATMLAMCKQCYPATKDLRLETVRLDDKLMMDQ